MKSIWIIRYIWIYITINIVVAIKNEALAKKLLEIIKSGFIRYKPKDNACVLVISPVIGLKYIVNLINGELKTPAVWIGISHKVGKNY